MKGSYTLLISVSEKIEVEVGSLGEIEFREGFYAYNGSAFGSGGLKRVERHKEKAREGVDPHWHIDYLLINQGAEIFEVFKSETDHECELSRKMSAIFGSKNGFGCSDCGCGSHLFYSKNRENLMDLLDSFYLERESL
jgi:endonuclease-3